MELNIHTHGVLFSCRGLWNTWCT